MIELDSDPSKIKKVVILSYFSQNSRVTESIFPVMRCYINGRSQKLEFLT